MKKRPKRGLLLALCGCLAVSFGLLAACTNTPGEHDHVYTNWETVTPATCTEGGTERATCSVCGNEETRPVDQLGHDWKVTGGNPATCTEDGTQTLKCERCGVEDTQDVKATGHVWNADTKTEDLISSAKCETEGERVVKCEACGERIHVPIPALGHRWETEGTVVLSPTCTEEGRELATCARCGVKDEIPVPALGHDWEAVYTIEKPATFEEAGSKSQHCTRCDEVKETVEIPKLEADKAMQYTFRVTRTNGDLITLAGITATVRSDTTGETTSITFRNGKAVAALLPDAYTVTVDTMPEGYSAETNYSVGWEYPSCTVTLTGSLAQGALSADARYVTGSAMHDFTVTTVATANRPQSETITLSELLKTKKMVMLNFWYVDCQFCRYEFPGMEAAYQQYQDDIAIIAIDPTDTSEEYIRNFVKDYGLSFYVAMDGAGLAARFNVSVYPTTVIIDSEGIVSEIHASALVNPNNYSDLDYCTRQFAAIFEKYTHAPYYTMTGANAVDYALPENK